ncbi:MAG: NADH-quinone oxidoreductase subunit D [Thermoproteota archaeon]|jgi:NADH:ubiquinone oxidoreductase 49 kD subunit 7
MVAYQKSEKKESSDIRTLTINVGPQHPSTHGPMDIVVTIEGETIIGADVKLGYIHRGIEKLCELRNYFQIPVYLNRLCYVSGMFWEYGFVKAVEEIMNQKVPERAEWLRVIACELTRIASHMIFFASFGADVGNLTLYSWGIRDRDRIIDVLELMSGQRMTFGYFRVGGVRYDVPVGFEENIEKSLRYVESHLRDYERLTVENPVFIARTENIILADSSKALDLGWTGPLLRATGLKRDLRRDEPYSVYDAIDFEIPVGKRGSVLDTFYVRIEEVKQSINIIRQAVKRIPSGPFQHRALLYPPPGIGYAHVEDSRGECGYMIVSDGTPKPYRVKIRSPAYVHVMSLPYILKGLRLADLYAVIGAIDPCLGEIDR